MPNTTSAKKRVRKNERRAAVNRSRRSQMRTAVRKVEEALTAGDKQAASDALKSAEPQIMRAAGHGVIHKNAAARKVSRLSVKVKRLGV